MTARKLTFGLRGSTLATTNPRPLEMWTPRGREKPALTYVLPVESFKRMAVRFGYLPTIGAFAVYKRPFGMDAMYFRCDRYAELALHEWRHIEEQRNFHGGDDHGH